jgi:hypothetical protein
MQQLAKISNKIYHFISYFKNKAVTCLYSPTTHYFSQPPLAVPPSCMCHWSYWYIQISWICDCITVYLKSSTYQSTLSPNMTPTQALKWKHVVFTWNQVMEILIKGLERVKIARRMNPVFSSCNWHTPFPILREFQLIFIVLKFPTFQNSKHNDRVFLLP